MGTARDRASPPHKLRAVWDAKKKKLGLTQQLAAEMLGFKAQATVNDYLSGKIALSYAVAIAFAKLLEVPLSEIWEGDAEAIFDALTVEEIVDLIATLPAQVQTELALQLLNKHHST
jgi:transcriptional regulator with XRE-family HTH domain